MATLVTSTSVGGKRNIIVLGKIGCGKSTLANKIICVKEEKKEPFKVLQSYQAVTREIEGAIEHVKIGEQVYVINMIDTIGFGDPGTKDKDTVDAIKKHMQSRAPEGINLVIFVFRNGRFSVEEKHVFRTITCNFKEYIKEMSCLVITGCDGLNKGARNSLVEDFKADDLTKEFAKIMTRGIYTVALPKLSNLSERAKDAAIEDMKDDMVPIHNAIADASQIYLHEEIQQESFWKKLFHKCTIL